MARQELHSDTLPIEQMPPIIQPEITDRTGSEVHHYHHYDGDIVKGETIREVALTPEYLAELAFMDEPVEIRIQPSSDKNAAMAFPVWVNGQGAQVFQNGRWNEIAYLPVGQEIIIKRKVLEVILRAKTDTIHTRVQEMDSERPNNVIQRFTTPVHSVSIIDDKNPRGAAWASEIVRRNL